VGDELRVKVIEVDSDGRIRLTAKDVDSDVIPEPRERGGDRGGRGSRGGRGRDRGSRSSDRENRGGNQGADQNQGAHTESAPSSGPVAADRGSDYSSDRGSAYFREKKK
jgi:polyribonucleotide nucleotidyltransferase